MPLLDGLEFAASNLFVGYRAAVEPQMLEIVVRSDSELPNPVTDAALAMLQRGVAEGAGAGAPFDPKAGVFEPLSQTSTGRELRWTVRVASVCPELLRIAIEKLRFAGGPGSATTGMSFMGQLPPDRTPASVDTYEMLRWLDGPRYPGITSNPGFPITTAESAAACWMVSVGGLNAALAAALEEIAFDWRSLVAEYVSDENTPVRIDAEHPHLQLPHSGWSKVEFRARYESFRHAAQPSYAMLINLLARFHATVAPIDACEVRL